MKSISISAAGVKKIRKAKGEWGFSSRMLVLKMRRQALERLEAKGFTPNKTTIGA